MAIRAKGTKTILKSPYRVGNGLSTIRIASESAELVYDATTKLPVTVKVEFRLAPTPELYVVASDPNVPRHTLSGKKVSQVYFPARGLSIAVMEAGTRNSRVELIPSRHPVIGRKPGTKRMRKVLFHVLNFPHCWGQTLDYSPRPNVSHRIYQNMLQADDWKITLSSLPSTPGAIQQIRSTGGLAVTHVGCIEKASGKTISVSDAQEMLKALHYYLSFARGAWAAPVLAVGLDGTGKPIWEDWGRRNADRWETVRSWFDGQHGAILEGPFPGFWKMWNDSLWGTQVQSAIYWYLVSNKSSRGVDAGIILTQAALELMAYTYLVRYKKVVRENDFKNPKKYPAEKKIDEILNPLRIPNTIPRGTRRLRLRAPQYGWKSGPNAFTQLRNSLVHARSRFATEKLLIDLEYEAWSLGLWYLEMTLLSLFDYNGKYANRLIQRRKLGQLNKVPWA